MLPPLKLVQSFIAVVEDGSGTFILAYTVRVSTLLPSNVGTECGMSKKCRFSAIFFDNHKRCLQNMENKFWCFTVMQCKCKMKNWIIFSGLSFLLAIAKKCQKSWWLTIHFNSTQNLKIVLFSTNFGLTGFFIGFENTFSAEFSSLSILQYKSATVRSYLQMYTLTI